MSVPSSCLAIVLAAGEGTRMRSSLPKVLHKVAGRSMVGHAIHALVQAGADPLAVVVGPGREDVASEARRFCAKAQVFEQRERLGTAHAVLAAREALTLGADHVIIAYGDTPLVRPESFEVLRQALREGAAVAVLGFEADDPSGYGRLLVEQGQLVAIREEKDASEAERAVRLCNAGLMALKGEHALSLLEAIGNENAKGEYYLTDAVSIAHARGLKAVALTVDEEDVLGVNDRAQLAHAEAVMQKRLRQAALLSGVTMIAPETVFLQADTKLARDVLIEPHVVFGPEVSVEEGAIIHAFSHLEGAKVGRGVSIGPFARLRPGAKLAQGARVGNFVEVKNASIGEGAKLNHLTYVGDAEVGAEANLGAGTITCNYDGKRKSRTIIGAHAFIGSNSALVAPVTIGEGAYVGSGSVITDDVPAKALALGRGRQVIKEGWAQGKE